jgi:hypothetical protein
LCLCWTRQYANLIDVTDAAWWEDLDEGNILVDIVGVEREVEILAIFKVL